MKAIIIIILMMLLYSCATTQGIWRTEYELKLDGYSKHEVKQVKAIDKATWTKDNRTNRLNIRKNMIEYNMDLISVNHEKKL